ncbi:hypothetical protein HNY73_015239 [Argiope bruennichi]|uniref:Uncharacterized protein n=1 Tax=Argiope bruennichi TaxID=94029 RepID=A0A8T0EW59_ARGBR|nr:hypothetical protein HNY73_015239 [Argiope bruennichi]
MGTRAVKMQNTWSLNLTIIGRLKSQSVKRKDICRKVKILNGDSKEICPPMNPARRYRPIREAPIDGARQDS